MPPKQASGSSSRSKAPTQQQHSSSEEDTCDIETQTLQDFQRYSSPSNDSFSPHQLEQITDLILATD